MSTIGEEPIPLPLDIQRLPSDQKAVMPSEQNSSIQLVAAETVILEKDTNDNAVEKNDTKEDAIISNEMKDLTVKSVSGSEQDVNVENADEDEIIIVDDSDGVVVGEKKDVRDNPADVMVLGDDEEEPREKGREIFKGGWRYLGDDEVMQPGLLERPVIVEGKRRRSTVTRLEIGTPTVTTKAVFHKGSGTPLSEESHFTTVVNNHTADELKPLHRILFGNPGRVATIKKEVRKFCGFPFSKGSAEYEKRTKMILNLKAKEYALILNVFREFYLPKNKKDREDYATHLLDILMSPPKIDVQDSKTPKRGSSKTPVTSRKRQASGSAEPEAKRSKKSKKNSGRGRSIDDNTDDVDTSQGSQQSVEDNSDGEDDAGPTTEELKNACNDIIKDADLNKLTTKQVIEAVALIFPDLDVEKRRVEIKNIVKELVLNMNLAEPNASSS